MHALFLFLVLATPAAQAAGPAEPAAFDIASRLEACKQLPIQQQRACVEPYLDDLPEQIAEGLRFETDPDIQAASKQWKEAIDAALRAQAEALAARGGARNLLAAALLWPLPEPAEGEQWPVRSPQAEAWFAAARAAVPGDPLVAWMEASDCGGLTDECLGDEAISRLLEVDPDNAAVHLLALHPALQRGDDAASVLHLREAASADAYQTGFPELLRLIVDAHEGIAWPEPDPELGEALAAMWGISAPVTAEDFASVQAFGRTMAVTYTGLRPLTEICPDDGGGNADLRDECMAVYALAARRSDALVDRLIALVHLSRLTAGDASGDPWREQLRQIYWVQARGYALLPGSPDSGMTGGDYLRLYVDKGELGALQELMQRHGIPSSPPAGWLPAEPRQRALVTTGVPPG